MHVTGALYDALLIAQIMVLVHTLGLPRQALQQSVAVRTGAAPIVTEFTLSTRELPCRSPFHR